jgi:8-oxo-dGTP diphosphatase
MNARPELCVGAVAVTPDDHLLLVRRANAPGQGLWSLPGGRVERGETLYDAVVREVAEETNLDVVCGPLVGWVERIEPERHFVIMDFAVTVLGGDVRAGDDAADAAWVPLEEVTGLALVDGLLDFLADHGILRVL